MALAYSSSSSVSAPINVSGTCRQIAWHHSRSDDIIIVASSGSKFLASPISHVFASKRPKRPSRSGRCVGAALSATNGSALTAMQTGC